MTSITHPLRVTTLSKNQALARLSVSQDEARKLPAKQQKQRINSLKNEVELVLRDLAAPAVAEVLQKALEMALLGDKHMIRLILELHMSKPQAQEDTTGGRNAINIQINNLTNKKKKEIIDVEAISTGNDRHSEEYAEVDSASAEAGSDNGLQQADGRESSDR